MKALILSGGEGTRLRPLTHSQQKQLIPVANKPVLFYAIEDVIDAGVDEVGIVTGPNREEVRKKVQESDWGAEISFIHQKEPKGIAHAVKVAANKGFLDRNESFVLFLGDNLLKEGIERHAREFRENGYDASIMLTEVENPEQFGVADLEDNEVKELVEKPSEPPSNKALVGIYFFKPIILEAVEEIEPSWRNELEITDAIQWLIDKNKEVGYTEVNGWWKDTGKPQDMLEANRLKLDEITRDVKTEIKDSEIKGRVQVPESAEVIDSEIQGPATIGENCKIKNSYIGPYTSIGEKTTIEETEVMNSIILNNCELEKCSRLIESLLGENVEIKEKSDKPSGNKFVVGDNSKLEL